VSIKPPKLSRRPRVVEAEACPRCGAKLGQTCRTWEGRGGPPHALDDVPPKPAVAPASAATASDSSSSEPPTQGTLFLLD
jgi:hypothetical protein